VLKAILRTAAVVGVALGSAASAWAGSDAAVWRPSNGFWYSLNSASAFTSSWTSPIAFGSKSAGDVPFMSDVDGDGVRDLIVWRASTGTWYALTSSSGYDPNKAIGKQWGNQGLGDIPLLTDVDGDGNADFTVWRASTGTFYWLTSSSRYTVAGSRQWGNKSLGDQPLNADFDGDGRSDLAVWRASTGTFYWLTSSSGYATAGSRQWGSGAAGDVPMIGDVDGDGRSDLLVWRAPSGIWFWLTSSSGYSYSASGMRQWGTKTLADVPMLGDFDGDRRADLTVWRPGTGMWFWLTAASGYSTSASGMRQWGGLGDVPVISTTFRNTGGGGAGAPAPTPAPAPAPAPAPSPSPAPAPTSGVPLRVLQWNTHHGGYGTDGVYSTDRLASWAAAMKPDVILFNEIERNTGWGHEDQPEVYRSLMQQKTGRTWYALFAQEFGSWSATGKGNLILSTYPIQASDRYELVHNADRSIGMAAINVNGRPITLISTHLDPYDASLRLVQAQEVTTWSAAQPENRIITGDMNAWPDQTSIGHINQTYYDSWTVAANQGAATAFAGNAGETKNGRIDYIFYSKNSPNLAVMSSQVYDTRDSAGVMPSDHRPVLTTFIVR
jgi:endonuclease/exonuclease/phosphatase family metal-dependent hydrolase